MHNTNKGIKYRDFVLLGVNFIIAIDVINTIIIHNNHHHSTLTFIKKEKREKSHTHRHSLYQRVEVEYVCELYIYTRHARDTAHVAKVTPSSKTSSIRFFSPLHARSQCIVLREEDGKEDN